MLWTNLKLVANKETLSIQKMRLTLQYSPLMKGSCKPKSKNKKFTTFLKQRQSFGQNPVHQKTCWQPTSGSTLKRTSHLSTAMAAYASLMISKSLWFILRSIKTISRMISQCLFREMVTSKYQTRCCNPLKAFRFLPAILLMISLMFWDLLRLISLRTVIWSRESLWTQNISLLGCRKY